MGAGEKGSGGGCGRAGRVRDGDEENRSVWVRVGGEGNWIGRVAAGKGESMSDRGNRR